MEDELKGLMERLGDTINRSLGESAEIAAAMEEIRQAGYEVSLKLEATIGFSKKGDDETFTLLERPGEE